MSGAQVRWRTRRRGFFAFPRRHLALCGPAEAGRRALWRKRKIIVNRTHTLTACTCAVQCVSTYTEQHDHISSREHAWPKGAQLRVARIGVSKDRPRVTSRSLPQLTLTTITSSLASTSPVFQSFSPSVTPKSFGARSTYPARLTAEWRVYSNLISHKKKMKFLVDFYT